MTGLSDVWECCGGPLSLMRGGRPMHLPHVKASASVVRCRSGGVPQPCCFFFLQKGRLRRLDIEKGLLLISRKPGPAEDSLLLSGAKVIVSPAPKRCYVFESHASVVQVVPSHSPTASLALWFDDAAEAERWAGDLREAAQLADRFKKPVSAIGSLPASGNSQGDQRKQTAKIAELEARVSATLHAAVDRSKRIKELEATVEAKKEQDSRVLELEQAVEEASHLGERVKELEQLLTSRGAIRDGAASAVLEDAMRFAEQMLDNRQDELAIDGTGASKLQDAVAAVKESNPAIDGDVAELVSQLVTALRWPLVLRKRLADAEQTVKTQRVTETKALSELQDLQQQRSIDEIEKRQSEAEISALRQQLAIAEDTAKQAQLKLSALKDTFDAVRVEEIRKIHEDSASAEAQRADAEEQSRQLQRQLMSAEAQKEALDADHKKELRTLQEQNAQKEASKDLQREEEVKVMQRDKEIAELRKKQAEEQVEELRERLIALSDGKQHSQVTDAPVIGDGASKKEMPRPAAGLQSKPAVTEMPRVTSPKKRPEAARSIHNELEDQLAMAERAVLGLDDDEPGAVPDMAPKVSAGVVKGVVSGQPLSPTDAVARQVQPRGFGGMPPAVQPRPTQFPTTSQGPPGRPVMQPVLRPPAGGRTTPGWRAT